MRDPKDFEYHIKFESRLEEVGISSNLGKILDDQHSDEIKGPLTRKSMLSAFGQLLVRLFAPSATIFWEDG
jgi:hypothetical protein